MTTTHIFLNGGGSEIESRRLDERFVSVLDPEKPVVYIPNAQASDSHLYALAWFTSVMLELGVSRVEMWNDLRPKAKDTSGVSGIYIGGGDTFKLLRELRKTKFDAYLREAAQIGIPIYGGSAGAIVLGEDIRTAPEASDISAHKARGIGLVEGYSISCHYTSKDLSRIRKEVKAFGHSVIAIPTKAGVYIHGNTIANYGTKPVVVLATDGAEKTIKPGETLTDGKSQIQA